LPCDFRDTKEDCEKAEIDHKTSNPDEGCEPSNDSNHECSEVSPEVVCLRRFKCEWDDNTDTCFEGNQSTPVKAPIDCLDNCSLPEP